MSEKIQMDYKVSIVRAINGKETISEIILRNVTSIKKENDILSIWTNGIEEYDFATDTIISIEPVSIRGGNEANRWKIEVRKWARK